MDRRANRRTAASTSMRVLALLLWATAGASAMAQTDPDPFQPAEPAEPVEAERLSPSEFRRAVFEYKRADGPNEVLSGIAEWVDAARGQTLPVRIYRPASIARNQKAPWIVFSPDLGGTRDDYAYLGRHWASHGYVVLMLTHRDGHAVASRPGNARVKTLADDAINWLARTEDVRFCIEHAQRERGLGDALDANQLAVAGQGIGAMTALMMVGLQVDMPRGALRSRRVDNARFNDERVRAAIAISPPGEDAAGLDSRAWNQINRPVLHLTGTSDTGWGAASARSRRDGFDRCPAMDQHLVVLRGADASTFADVPLATASLAQRRKVADADHLDAIRMATTAFLDGYALDIEAGRNWLADRKLRRWTNGRTEQATKSLRVTVKKPGAAQAKGPVAAEPATESEEEAPAKSSRRRGRR